MTNATKKLRIKNRKTPLQDTKYKFQQTTTASSILETSEKNEEWYDKSKENSNYISVGDLLKLIIEGDESGGGSIPEDVEDEKDYPGDPKSSGNIIIFEEELETIYIEANTTRTQNAKSQNPSSSQRPLSELPCVKTYLEFYIYSLIASNQLPKDTVFLTWQEKPTLGEKISFLNQTLITSQLKPLPSCSLGDLDLDISRQRLDFFIKIQTTAISQTAYDRNDQAQEKDDATGDLGNLKGKDYLTEELNLYFLS